MIVAKLLIMIGLILNILGVGLLTRNLILMCRRGLELGHARPQYRHRPRWFAFGMRVLRT
jgi:hypothetical protein